MARELADAGKSRSTMMISLSLTPRAVAPGLVPSLVGMHAAAYFDHGIWRTPGPQSNPAIVFPPPAAGRAPPAPPTEVDPPPALPPAPPVRAAAPPGVEPDPDDGELPLPEPVDDDASVSPSPEKQLFSKSPAATFSKPHSSSAP